MTALIWNAFLDMIYVGSIIPGSHWVMIKCHGLHMAYVLVRKTNVHSTMIRGMLWALHEGSLKEHRNG